MANNAGQLVQVQYIVGLIGSHTQDTTISAATSVTVPEGANAVYLSAQSQNVLFTLDGTVPTTTLGLLLKADAGAVLVPVYPGQTLKFIEAAASAKLDWQFCKYGV